MDVNLWGLPKDLAGPNRIKGGSEENASSNQNEETNNQSQASTVSMQVRHQGIKSADQPSLFADEEKGF